MTELEIATLLAEFPETPAWIVTRDGMTLKQARKLMKLRRPALASRFATFAIAMRMADKIGDDDPEWSYNVERHGLYFVIAVYDEDDADIVFLGYL